MNPQFYACDILCEVATPVRLRILAGMPGTAQDYAVHGAASVMDIERFTDAGDPVRAVRAMNMARRSLKAAADLGRADCADLLARII